MLRFVSIRPPKRLLISSATAKIQKSFYGSTTGLTEAVRAMKEALRQRKATPAEIAKYAVEAGIWEKVVQPRLEALTVDA